MKSIGIRVPPEDEDILDRLEREGRLTRATGNLLDLGPPLPPKPGVPLPSEELARMREHER